MERYAKLKRKTAYLYFGLVLAAMALIMIVVSVLSMVHGEKTSVIVTGFAAGIAWGIAAASCLHIYYKYNRSQLALLENSTDSADNKK